MLWLGTENRNFQLFRKLKMRSPFKIITFISIILVLSLGVFYFWVSQYGVSLLQKGLNQIFQQPVSIQEVRVVFPATVILTGVKVPEVFEAQILRCRLGVPQVFKKELVIAKIKVQNPKVWITRQQLNRLASESVELKAKLPAKNAVGSINGEQKNWGIKIGKILVQNGAVHFADSQTGWSVQVKNTELTIRNLTYPLQPGAMSFQLLGECQGQQIPFAVRRIQARGRVDWFLRNMDVHLALLDVKNVPVLSATAKSVNNEVTVTGRVKMSSLSFASKIKQDEGNSSVPDFLFGAAKAAGVEADMNFRFQTRMDNFQVEKMSISGNIGYTAPEQGKAGKTQ